MKNYDVEIDKAIKAAGYPFFKECTCSGIYKRKYGVRGQRELHYAPNKLKLELHGMRTQIRRGLERQVFGFIALSHTNDYVNFLNLHKI